MERNLPPGDDPAADRAAIEPSDLALGTGFSAVEGRGLRVTVDDQPAGDPDGLVRATDLRVLVNGLWQAGAEAIAINGRRLTALSAIVNADIAIQVNKGPLSPPLDVTRSPKPSPSLSSPPPGYVRVSKHHSAEK